MLDKTVSSGENSLYRKAIWVYVFFLIFEGALRRWFLPGLSTPLLLVRDPIVIWLIYVGIPKGWLKSRYVLIILLVSTISLILTLLVGHQSLYAALYGWRIYFFYFPFMFVMGQILTRDDVLKIGRFIVYLSVPMTLLIIIQFYSPQSAWVNRGVGGDMEGAGLQGAMGYFRPTGTFSFTASYAMYQLVTGCFLAYYILMNKALDKTQQINSGLLWVILGCFILSLPYSISRTHLFSTAVIVCFLFFILWNKRYYYQLISTVILVAIIVAVLIETGIASESMMAMMERFTQASEVEGGTVSGTIRDRYINGLLSGLYSDDMPFWGYGLGSGTNVGAKLIADGDLFTFFDGEREWNRIMFESGLLCGWAILVVRCLLSLSIFVNAYRILKKKNDFLPWMFLPAVLITLPQGQLGNPTNLGFIVFIAGLALASIKD